MHLDVVIAVKQAFAVGAIVVIAYLMVCPLLYSRPRLITNATLVMPVVLGVHVVDDGAACPEIGRAPITFVLWDRMV